MLVGMQKCKANIYKIKIKSIGTDENIEFYNNRYAYCANIFIFI